MDNSNTDPDRRHIRVLSTTGGFDHEGHPLYYNIFGMVMPDTFTNDAAGRRAMNIANFFSAYIFPKASGDPLSPALPNRRQDNVFDTRNGYFEANPLGLPAPKFVSLMRRLEPGAATAFSLERGDYYDAVSFDDSVFRVQRALAAHPEAIEAYEIVLIDEYQDFNGLEAALLDLLATRSPIVIAGDDDQALYSLLRSSSPAFIRARYGGGSYERFVLPFCMRCPEAIVRAVGDIVERARAHGLLGGRIAKPYEPYPPRKGRDSARYPRIRIVQTSVQSLRANYFGRYIAEQIEAIPAEEIAATRQGSGEHSS